LICFKVKNIPPPAARAVASYFCDQK